MFTRFTYAFCSEEFSKRSLFSHDCSSVFLSTFKIFLDARAYRERICKHANNIAAKYISHRIISQFPYVLFHNLPEVAKISVGNRTSKPLKAKNIYCIVSFVLPQAFQTISKISYENKKRESRTRQVC